MSDDNKNPEQIARDEIDARLRASGWAVQDNKAINHGAAAGVAVREYKTSIGPADYVMFAEKRPLGVVEAKPESWGAKITTVEEQSSGYAAAQLKWVKTADPLPFIYESTGTITRFTDGREPKPRSREVFSFHRPETLRDWLAAPKSFRAALQDLPPLNTAALRDCQITAITKLEESLKDGRPRALVQMATGSGKTFTAISEVYRLLKFAGARRVLFLVDTRNLGEQAEQEFLSFVPNDENRKFTELYTVQRLTSSYISPHAQVCISTIQRLYSIPKGEDLPAGAEDDNPAERRQLRKDPLPVVYNASLPPEFFDVVIIDECHRSIYNLWRQVIEYFDSFLIGLTATPDNRTYAFFQKNVVSEYTHEKAVADGVNVGNEVYLIETEVTSAGAKIKAEQLVERRERQTRRKRWETQDAEEAYAATQLDRSVVTRSVKTASQPLDTKPSVPFRDLAMGVMMGATDEDTVSSLAARLSRLDKQLGPEEQKRITDQAGQPLSRLVRDLFDAIDGDRVEAAAKAATGQEDPDDKAMDAARDALVSQAAKVLTGPLIELLDTIRRDHEQTIDHDNLDTLQTAGWAGEATTNATAIKAEFEEWLTAHRDSIEALTIWFSQPARRSDVTFAMVRSLLEQLKADRPRLAPAYVWRAYAHLEDYKGTAPLSDLTQLVALVRRVAGLDATLTTVEDRTRRNFQTWIMRRHSGSGDKFTESQMAWLHMIRDHIATSIRIERDDLDFAPFDAAGGLGRMHALFGPGMDGVLDEMNEALAV